MHSINISIRAVVAIAISGVLIATAIALVPSGATAAVSGFDMTGDSTTRDDGTVREVLLKANGTWQYTGLDTNASVVQVGLEVQNPNGSWELVNSQEITVNNTSGSGDYMLTQKPLFASTSWTPEDMAATTDGETNETTVNARLTLSVKDSNGNELTTATRSTTFTITVTNRVSDSNVDGAGSATISGK